MNYSKIWGRAKDLLLWVYKNISDKFTGALGILQGRFPIINKYPVLRYSLIPLFIGAFLLLRNIIKIVINELAAWVSNFVGETAGYSISERTIVLAIAATFIILRVALKLRKPKKEINGQIEFAK